MFCGCFTFNGTGRLSPSKGMMNSSKYVEVLEKTWFQHCKIHSQMAMVFFSRTLYYDTLEKKTQTFFKKSKLTLLDWPGNSQDLNP